MEATVNVFGQTVGYVPATYEPGAKTYTLADLPGLKAKYPGATDAMLDALVAPPKKTVKAAAPVRVFGNAANTSAFGPPISGKFGVDDFEDKRDQRTILFDDNGQPFTSWYGGTGRLKFDKGYYGKDLYFADLSKGMFGRFLKAAGIIGGFLGGASAIWGTGLGAVSAVSGNVAPGISLAGNVTNIGTGVTVSGAAFDSALAASTGYWPTASSLLTDAKGLFSTASNVVKVVQAVNSVSGAKATFPVNQVPSGWTVDTTQTPGDLFLDPSQTPKGDQQNQGVVPAVTNITGGGSGGSLVPLLMVALFGYLAIKGHK